MNGHGVLHEHVHRLALVTEKVVDFGKNQTGHIAGARQVNGVAKEPMVWRALDEVVNERPSVADERRCATGPH